MLLHREIAEMPDSPVVASNQGIFDHLNPVSASQLPNQPHFGWPPTSVGDDFQFQDPAGLPEDRTYWEYVAYGMSGEVVNRSNGGPLSSVPNGASSSFQDSYDFGGAMELSGSMYLEDRLGRQLAVSDSDLVATNDVGGLLVETYGSDNTQYPME
jgi:hypothetical protein